jgi:hypothetical protein
MEKANYYRIILVKIKWSPWNPWCLGRMNLAWKKYTETSMYKSRKELEKVSPVNFRDFAYKAFVDNYEIKHFMARFTRKEKIKLFLAPFSFGAKFRMPFRQLENRILVKS